MKTTGQGLIKQHALIPSEMNEHERAIVAHSFMNNKARPMRIVKMIE